MNIIKFNFLLIIIIIILKTNIAQSFDIKILVTVDGEIITNQDLKNEKTILSYLYNNQIDEKNLNNIALNSLIEEKIKFLEVQKKKILISEEESSSMVDIILKNKNKSLEDFKNNFNNLIYLNHLQKKIQIEISWNRLIYYKYFNLIDINTNEVNVLMANKNIGEKQLDNIILNEKNKKLQSLSEAYFNDIKNKSLIKNQ